MRAAGSPWGTIALSLHMPGTKWCHSARWRPTRVIQSKPGSPWDLVMRGLGVLGLTDSGVVEPI